MERFSRYLFLSVLGVGVFSVIIPGFFDVVEGQPFQGLAMIFRTTPWSRPQPDGPPTVTGTDAQWRRPLQ